MSGRFGRHSLSVGVLALALPRFASAQTSEPGLTTVEPRAAGVELSPELPPKKPGEAEAPHVFEAYRAYADSMASQRRAGAVGALIIGGTFIGVGAVAHEEWDEGFGTVLVVGGAIVAATGVLTWVIPTESDSVANAQGVYTTKQPSSEQERMLEAEWHRLASKARTARHIGAGISFVLSAAALGGGIYAMASNGIEENTQRWLVPTLLLSGGAAAAGGVTTLMVETPTESAYAAFRAAQGRSGTPELSRSLGVRLSAAPLQRGAWGGFAMDF